MSAEWSPPEDGTGLEPARSGPAPRLGWHPVDPVSLVAGVVAVGLALVALLDVDLDASLVVPALLVVAGLVGLLATVRRGRSGPEAGR